MAYNLHLFERIVFSVPSARRSRRLLVGGGSVCGVVVYLLAGINGHLPWSPAVLLGSVIVFVGPSLAVAVAVPRVIPGYPANWSYFLAASIVLVVSAHVGAAVAVGTTDAVVQLGVVTAYLLGVVVLVLTAGTGRFATIGVLSAVSPLALVWVPNVVDAVETGVVPPATETAVLVGVTGVATGLSVTVHERLMDANVPFIDGARLISGLLQSREEDIDAGWYCEPTVQSLVIDADARTTLVAPWVHPGPLQRFGGATVATDLITHTPDGGQQFFLKIPTTHERDPATTAAAERIAGAVAVPDTTADASRLLTRTYGEVTYHGRRFGDQRIVLVEPHFAGDVPLSVIADVIDPSRTLVVDRHTADPDGGRWVTYGSTDARTIREGLRTFLTDLDDADATHEYRAGAAVDTDGKELLALVEAVDGQRTLLLSTNENEVGESVRSLVPELTESFDEVVVCSTDTHHDIHDLASRAPIDADRIRDAVRTATSRCGPARIGLEEETAERMRLLDRHYYALMYTINLITRSFGVSLVVLYLAVVSYVFLIR